MQINLYTSAFVSLACMDGPHVVEYPLAVLVNMVELHVVHVVLPRWLHHAVLLPVASPVRHVTLNESIRLLSER